MFQRLLRDAKSAASSLVLKYVARASVAIPFVIAFGFALAAVTVMLVQRFGHVTAYWIMAGGLAIVGVIATVTVSVKEHEDGIAEQQTQQTDTTEMVSEVVAQAPLALLGALFASPGGASFALAAARLTARHFPLNKRKKKKPTRKSPTPSPMGFERGSYAH